MFRRYRSIRQLLATGLVGLALIVADPAMRSASACPMCKDANETAENDEAAVRPAAYMYSILFMLSMPVMLFSGFGVAFYRLSRQAAAEPVDEFGQPVEDVMPPSETE